MNITFKPLEATDFPCMLKWLGMPHVKKWWDQEIVYTMDLVREKYASYVKGYKEVDGAHKPIKAFIIHVEEEPIGYIQTYNAYNFPRNEPLMSLPKKLAALDIFIGEKEYVGKGIGSDAIKKFLHLYVCDDVSVFVDPDTRNIAAIKAYEKAGFIKHSTHEDKEAIWMIYLPSHQHAERNASIAIAKIVENKIQTILLKYHLLHRNY